jgi:arabinofuranosyltransferase
MALRRSARYQRHMRAHRLAVIVVVLVVLGWLVAAGSFWFVCDDAYISFRYARHLAQGHGLRFNLDEAPPVEGYSNFLWVLIASAFELVRIPPALGMPVVSLAAGVAFLLRFWRASIDRLDMPSWVASLATAALAFSPGFVVWGTSGLETLPAALLLFVVFDAWVLDRDPDAGQRGLWPAVGLSLIRTEGIAWVAVLGLLALGVRALEPGRRADGARALVWAWGRACGVYAVYYILRLGYFHTWVSNTAIAKVDLGWDNLDRGTLYVIGFWLTAITPLAHLLLAPFALGRARTTGLAIVAMACAAPLYAALIGGDFMTMGRLLVPGLAFGALTAGLAVAWADRAWRPLGAAAAVALMLLTVAGTAPLFDTELTPRKLRKRFEVRLNTEGYKSEYQQWRFMWGNTKQWLLLGHALHEVEKPGDSLVIGAVGAVGYASDIKVFDQYGIVTPEVAHRPGKPRHDRSPGHDKFVPVSYFMKDDPTWLWARTYRGGTVRRALTDIAEFNKPEIRTRYAPRVDVVEVAGAPVFLVTLSESGQPDKDWDEFATVLQQTLAGPKSGL